MRINYLKSYDRCFKKLTSQEQEKTIQAIDALLDFLKSGKKSKGLGLKKLRKDYWEIRIDIKNRIIFEFKKEILNIISVGDHQVVKRLLKGL